jgi:hypothetical protein
MYSSKIIVLPKLTFKKFFLLNAVSDTLMHRLFQISLKNLNQTWKYFLLNQESMWGQLMKNPEAENIMPLSL